jgi:predicted RNA-binding protein
MKNWINLVSKDHVERGKKGGFTQANHGAPYNLKKLAKGDWIVFYSSKTSFDNGEKLQKFTAIGYVTDDEPYQAEMNPDFRPWRRNMKFIECEEVLIHPLIEELSFIQDKKKWGYPFRRGMFKISKNDFKIISNAMGININSAKES